MITQSSFRSLVTIMRPNKCKSFNSTEVGRATKDFYWSMMKVLSELNNMKQVIDHEHICTCIETYATHCYHFLIKRRMGKGTGPSVRASPVGTIYILDIRVPAHPIAPGKGARVVNFIKIYLQSVYMYICTCSTCTFASRSFRTAACATVAFKYQDRCGSLGPLSQAGRLRFSAQ